MSVSCYPIGTLGQPWGAEELALWRAKQLRHRSYADDVLRVLESLQDQFHMACYGELVYGHQRFALMAARSQDWQSGLPGALITGGVHGYETSGVHGALRFLAEHAHAYAGRVNLLIAPCVSPWAYERIQRWNFDALDPNRSFLHDETTQESAALMRLVAPLQGQLALHMDLHETTDSDESEFRPALAARDGKVFEPGLIPDGFYLVDDSANPQPAFQAAIIEAVQGVTHIAPADAKGQIIGSEVVSRGVIQYDMNGLGLCASISGARYTTTTEVYPDGVCTTPEQCITAQVTAMCAGLEFLLSGDRN
jgi:Succinylglutamate desuccinylase / Aspartoacylase family